MTNAVLDLLGDDMLMYASDYPHGESHFPKSVDTRDGVGPEGRAEAQAVLGQRGEAVCAVRVG